MRSDARENRERILDAARTLLSEAHGQSMVAVAKAAGIGQGTLYRHFPSWEALVMTVHRADVDDLVALAPRLLAEHRPILALRMWLDELARYGRIKRDLGRALSTAMHDRLGAEGTDPILGAIDLLLSAGRTDGSLRMDVGAADVLLLVGFLWRMDPTPDRDERSRRLLDLVVEGMRTPS